MCGAQKLIAWIERSTNSTAVKKAEHVLVEPLLEDAHFETSDWLLPYVVVVGAG